MNLPTFAREPVKGALQRLQEREARDREKRQAAQHEPRTRPDLARDERQEQWGSVEWYEQFAAQNFAEELEAREAAAEAAEENALISEALDQFITTAQETQTMTATITRKKASRNGKAQCAMCGGTGKNHAPAYEGEKCYHCDGTGSPTARQPLALSEEEENANATYGRAEFTMEDDEDAEQSAAVSGESLPPGETSSTTPAGIAAGERRRNGKHKDAPLPGVPGRGSELEKVGRLPQVARYTALNERELELRLLDRHPDNRVPTAAEIETLAADFRETSRQLEALVVRGDGQGRYQILSGETRWLAAKAAGWKVLRCRIVDCDDATALELLAKHNALRKDLNPIQKARLIKRLCEPVAQGGSGYTREAAGKIYGLESGGGASNLVRLLELPAVWQDRVASGELPPTFARELLPYVHAPRLMEVFDVHYREDHRPKADEWDREAWEHREQLEDLLSNLVAKHTRPLSGKQSVYGVANVPPGFNGHPLAFKAEANRHLLDVVKLKIGKTEVEVATDTVVWDKLQVAALEDKKRGAAAQAGRDKPAEKRELTPAQRKAKQKEQAEQLAARIGGWRHNWLKGLVATKLAKIEGEQTQAVLARLCAWLMTAPLAGGYALSAFDLDDVLCEGLGVKHGHRLGDDTWRAIAAVEPLDCSRLWKAEVGLICHLFTLEDKDWRRPLLDHELLDHELVEDCARELSIDLAAEWDALHVIGRRQRCEEFFLLHQSDALRELAKELGVFVGESDPKGMVVKKLLTVMETRRLPVPKSIKPLATAKSAKAAKKGRGK